MPANIFEDGAFRPISLWRSGGLPIQLGAAAALVALADALFYGHSIGVSLAIFLAALAGSSACLNKVRAEMARRWCAALLMTAGLLPIIEDANWLSATIALLATAACARLLTDAHDLHWRDHLRAAARWPFAGVFRLFSDLSRASRYRTRRGKRSVVLAWLLGWMFPLLLCAGFAALFLVANPLLEIWLRRIDLGAAFAQIVSARSIFWAVMLCLIWPLIRIRSMRSRRRPLAPPLATVAAIHPLDPLSDGAIRRSLVLFNGLFAVQTTMDIVFLWGGASLPDGMSHAAYAHRGAYPLVATALLAAVFVLIAMRPAGSSERDPRIRPLIITWVAQNILLVLSALLRLDFYVEAYSLTELRMAAFVWMLLVVAGLVLILVQVAWRKGIDWLVSANALALALTLYAYSFIDTAAIIAHYNLRHSYEMRGEGPAIDSGYLFSLGPSVVPALDRYAPQGVDGEIVAARRAMLAQQHLSSPTDWRSWSFRGWRLSRYLANNPVGPLKAMLDSPTHPSEAR